MPLERTHWSYFNNFANRLIWFNVTKILSNSQYALDQFYEGYWEKDKRFKVIPNGVDASLGTTDLLATRYNIVNI